ncbi:MAG: cation:proton antiporter [Parachlamydiaceae bacterium]|nr:cation:proton antiporter [Parachlamydiaceae bacterium]
METEAINLKIVVILSIGFGFASIFGYITQCLKLSPILGYLLAGYVIGPYSPGYVADLAVSEQLAEIGVVLMMFGVGMHFKWEELVSVKSIAIPGAIIQTLVATILCTFFLHHIGWSIEAGIIIGLAVGVASTAVLVRILTDNSLLNTTEGHIAVGWLIVEDVLTVAALLILPTIAASSHGKNISMGDISVAIIFMVLKFAALIGIMFSIGQKGVSYILLKVARTRSNELFTLTILALIFIIATGSMLIFGTSIALGAFIAGMVVGQTDVRQQASANSLPLKDAFVVIFFLSIGMLFNPSAIMNNFSLFLGILGIILIIKPLVAFLIVIAFRYPFKIAFTIALALAQIGEFSFILAEEATKLDIIPDIGYDVIIACALVSISLNPLIFKVIEKVSFFMQNKLGPSTTFFDAKYKLKPSNIALVVGYGPIGQTVIDAIKKIGMNPIVIDRNIDTIVNLRERHQEAVFGDASHPDILEAAQIKNAKLLIITIPEINTSVNIIENAEKLNPNIRILARVRYTHDQHLLKNLGVDFVCCEEEEAKKVFNIELQKFS